MAALKPFAVYGLTVPAGDIAIEADGSIPYPATFRVTMAAIDPNAELDSDVPKRATLKLIKTRAPEFDSDDEDDDFDDDDVAAIERRLGLTSEDDDDDDEEESDDEKNGGPSDPEKTKKARAEALIKALKDDEEMDDLELTNGINGIKSIKGKAKAVEDELDVDEDEDEDSEDEDIKEYVICTLDPEKNYQQPLDITLNNEHEMCYFKATGPYKIYLTGNFCIPPDIDSEEEEDENSDDDELGLLPEELEDMSDSEDEEDELDDLDDPRITEVVDEGDKAPKLVKAAETLKKGKNKRPAEEYESEDEDAERVGDLLRQILKAPAPEEKLSKKQKKKLKNNAGEAVPATAGAEKDKKPTSTETKEPANKDNSANSSKKVQFAKNLEQGPTPTKAGNQAKAGTKNVEGVIIDDRKPGQGKQAKKGDRVELRYIGKLQDGKVFDANKKGKPFGFKIGDGSVIKGWDIGIQGMAVGGERRITIPAKLAYGNKSMPGIPANSELIFDLKLISIK